MKTDVAAASDYLFSRFLTPELWSSVFSVMIGLSSLVGAAILSARPQEDKCGRKVSVRLGYIAVVVLLLTAGYWLLVDRGLSLNAFLILLCVGCLLIGFLVVMINVPTNTVLMRVVDRDMLSKVSSIVSIVSQGLIPISSVLAGSVLQYLGSTILLLVCALGFTATALFLLFNRQVREI